MTPPDDRIALYDRRTLEAVHDFFEFEARSNHDMHRWLHREILQARKGRALTPEEEAIFMEGFTREGSER